jgi:hypothetical protein
VTVYVFTGYYLRRVAPHLGTVLKAAALSSYDAIKQDSVDVPGVLSLGGQGQVVQHTCAAERWLKELGDLRPGLREGADLPTAVRMIAAP